jgi:hypothetical protein
MVKHAAKRKPVRKEVEEREAKRVGNRIRERRKYRRRRLAVVYDVKGPRVSLGCAWFAVVVLALLAGRFALGLLYSLTASAAAFQAAFAWQKAGARPHRLAAGAGALGIGVCGALATPLVGIAILAFVGVSLFFSYGIAARSRGRLDPIVMTSFTIRCGLFAGFAAASVGITARYSLTGAVGLVLIVSAYEVGDFLVGSGANNPYEGPVAGAAAIVVVTFAITALGLKPFVFPGSFALAALAAVLCPMGQLVASLILPKVDAPATALRRIDSLLVLAPAWALAVSRLL